MSASLSGHVALVVGAGHGAGREVALELARHGAAVAVNDISEVRAASTAAEIAARGATSVTVPGDAADEASVAAFVERSSELGPVDILVIGTALPSGVVNVTGAVLPGMIERRWGRVVTITTDAATDPESDDASESGGAVLTRALAAEVGRHGITCNSLSLAAVATPVVGADAVDEEPRLRPTGRATQPRSIGAAVAFLASGCSGWITGRTIPVTAG